jgi:hypothetical protein
MGSAGAAIGSSDIFRPAMKPSFCQLIITIVFMVCPCSLLIYHVSPGSPSHLKLFDIGGSSVYLADLVLRGIFFFAWSACIRLSVGDTPS